MADSKNEARVDVVGEAFSALGTSTGATGAQDETMRDIDRAGAGLAGGTASGAGSAGSAGGAIGGAGTSAAGGPAGGACAAGEAADAPAFMPTVDPSRIRAVFFDLDGTLLPMDLDEFLGSYFKAIGEFVAARSADLAGFSTGFAQGMKAMAHHEPNITNCQAFWDEFFRHADASSCDWQSLLTEFYTREFPKVGKNVVPNPACARVLDAFAAKGYPLVLATMPYFPPVAVEGRLAWANVSPRMFARLTHYENSRAAKPSEFYYAEQLVACGLRADEILMVGNNTVEDGAFARMGAHLFLTTDWLLNPSGTSLAAVPHGTMEQFADWVDSLPPCSNPARDIFEGLVDESACRKAYEEATRTR